MNNKLTNCKACGNELAKGVKKCTSCGKDQRNFFMKHKILTGILVLAIIGAIGSDGGDNANSSMDNQSKEVAQNTEVESREDVATEEETKESVPTEYKSALKQAKTYSDVMNMSKAGIYDQLTSEYGGQFTEEAAQYAIDNVEADWKENALKSAETYQETMSMSPAAIYDQLVSQYGGQFTEEEAQYAIDNLE